jgi:drug/metabolite transporter (DMT)-like permease
MKSRSSWIPIYIILGIVWGCSFVFIKSGLEFLSPVGVAFFRCALGALTLYSYARSKGISLPRNRIALAHIWVVSLLLNVIPGIFYALAETAVTSILAAIMNAVTPLMTVLAILLINREEKPELHQLIGLLLGFIGVLTVLGAWAGLGDNPLWAILILLFAVACYGITFPYTRRFVMPLQLKSEAIVATQLISATTTLLPIYLVSGVSITSIPFIPAVSMIALGVFGSGFAYLWNFKIMQLAGSAIASSVTYLTPLVAVIVGVIFLSEKVTWNEPVGALVVLLGAAIAQERIKIRRRTRY